MDGLNKEKKEADVDDMKKEQMEKKVKNYQELKEKFRTIEMEEDEEQIKDKNDDQQDLLKTRVIEDELKDLEKEAATCEQNV